MNTQPVEPILYQIAKHSGFTEQDVDESKCFVSYVRGGESDHTTVAMVRYVNPCNGDDWAYDIYVVEDYDQPSLVFMTISRVFSYYHELFFKRELI